MGIVWEAYHKGVPLLEVPGITLEDILEFGANKQKTVWTSVFQKRLMKNEQVERFHVFCGSYLKAKMDLQLYV